MQTARLDIVYINNKSEVDKKQMLDKKLNNLLTELNLTVTPRIIEKVKLHYDIEQTRKTDLFCLFIEQELNLDILRKYLDKAHLRKNIVLD